MNERIGVYICHCGGNIADYIDVAKAQQIMQNEEGVLISKHVMFACSDATQSEMVEDIKNNNLDAIVVASCSPKLHLHTFRGVADRAGLNKYNYIQVNIREQCSWAHSNNPIDATNKAIGLIKAGIKKARIAESLEISEIEANEANLVVGAGVSGMKAAIELAKNGNKVFLVEKENKVGGNILNLGNIFPTNEYGEDIIYNLNNQIKNNKNISLFTETEIEKVNGSLGNFSIELIKNKNSKNEERQSINVGSILITTGFENYKPKNEEYGYGLSDRIITLPELKKQLSSNSNSLLYKGNEVKSLAFIYCVGSRQSKGENKYCSRMCCTSAIKTAIDIKKYNKNTKILHLYRDIRTYGKSELLFEQASKQGDIFFKFEEKDPPLVNVNNDFINVKIKDYLTQKKEINFQSDLLVLVIGANPRTDSCDISSKFKIPIGADRFFNEIHPKLKPVETVINGVFIGGSCQAPKNITESVQSSLAAVSKMFSLIKNHKIQLDPIVAKVNTDTCIWCGKCDDVCEFDAVIKSTYNNKEIAKINPSSCKGCGICNPVCPSDSIDLKTFSNSEIEAMIDGFMSNIAFSETQSQTEEKILTPKKAITLKRFPEIWTKIANTMQNEHKTIPEIAQETGIDKEIITWHLMTMNKYFFVISDGIDKKDEYFYYKLNK